MANKLAGQRAKFSRARAIYYTSGDEQLRQRAAQLMAEVVAEAGSHGFTEEQVTQGEDVPDEVRRIAAGSRVPRDLPEEDPNRLVAQLGEAVDTELNIEIGQGSETVYAYGYRCAPDRLKVGRCSGDAVARIAAQISTATPDKPSLMMTIRTHDCAALERVLHGVMRLEGRQVPGAGAEWFIVSREEVLAIYQRVLGGGSTG